MEALLEKLAAHRRRVKVDRTLEAAVRWAFYVSLLGCVYLAASKVLGLTVPRSVAVTALVAVPLGMAAREWARSFTVRDCAIYLDGALGLDERLSTAVECSGPMAGAQAADASESFSKATFPSRRLPRETRLLLGSLAVMGGLLAIPSLERSGAADDPALEAVVLREAANLNALAEARVEFREVAKLLEEGKPEKAMEILQSLRERLAEELLAAEGVAGAEARKLLEAAETSMAAISAELARLGRVVHALPPTVVEKKLERQRWGGSAAKGADGFPPAPAAALARADWDPRYDLVIRGYFGRQP